MRRRGGQLEFVLDVLDARLDYAVANSAVMALVKGKADTSGPILRRAGFAAFGQEPQYRVPL